MSKFHFYIMICLHESASWYFSPRFLLYLSKVEITLLDPKRHLEIGSQSSASSLPKLVLSKVNIISHCLSRRLLAVCWYHSLLSVDEFSYEEVTQGIENIKASLDSSFHDERSCLSDILCGSQSWSYKPKYHSFLGEVYQQYSKTGKISNWAECWMSLRIHLSVYNWYKAWFISQLLYQIYIVHWTL